MNLLGVAEEARAQFKSAQLRNLYRTDFQAWKADVLGLRTYDYMEEIWNEALFGERNRTFIKSANGTSKSFEMAAAVSWAGSVFEPGEALSIVSAPSIGQIDKVIWTYMKSFRVMAEKNGHSLPGWLTETLGWKYAAPNGNIDLAYGRKPAPGQEVAVFQGTRSQFGRTFVFVDEAGGVSRGLFTAAEAVLTGAHARGIFCGNPDDPSPTNEFKKYFEDARFDNEVNRFTISFYDLPTHTGEVVYPDDPEMNQRMMDSLTSREWAEHKKRVWGENDPRYLSKVLGQFPPDGGWGFFSAHDINTSYDTEIEENLDTPCVFGVDLARMGMDESVLYVNRGGRVRLLDAWGKTDLYTSSQKIFQHAQRLKPSEIRIDGTGLGAGVWDNLAYAPEFAGPWEVIGIEGSSSPPDVTKHANKRAYVYDSVKEQMAEGLIDLDVEDEDLKDQLDLITFRYHKTRGSLVITPKDEMETEVGGSPDRADAFVYAACDLSPWTGNSLNQLTPGTKVSATPEQMIEDVGFEMNWLDLGGAF